MELALQARLTDIVEEHDRKMAGIDKSLSLFKTACDDLKSSCCVAGTWGQVNIDTGRVDMHDIKASLVKSAWLHIYKKLNIETIASATDKKAFEQSMISPPPFTMENIRASLGDYIADPWGNILRGLAECFCSLDQSYKSHEKVKIGANGLPKRIILGGFGEYSYWGKERLKDVLDALAAYQGKKLTSHYELNALIEDGSVLLTPNTFKTYDGKEIECPARGVRLKIFKNGNAHLFFEPDTLKDINKALSEYYGEVLADCSEERPTQRRPSTEISKDLQYYPTPIDVVERIVDGLYPINGDRVLEPSCGCGRFMEVLAHAGALVDGYEYDVGRANECRAKGLNVLVGNFLESVPTPIYDRVVMNPPFYGKHYAKHVEHAFKFLKPGGILTAILPVTARYDHGLLKGRWDDLPVGSFRESGVNINTTVLTMKKEGEI